MRFRDGRNKASPGSRRLENRGPRHLVLKRALVRRDRPRPHGTEADLRALDARRAMAVLDRRNRRKAIGTDNHVRLRGRVNHRHLHRRLWILTP